jgi:Holliday junction resolvase-like predicted endonuclease
MNFQSESKRSGDEFEDLVLEDLKERGFTAIKKNVYMPGTGCEVDFVASGQDMTTCHVEAKGGRDDDKKRPGAQRTDNVKKAVANGALIKTKYPDTHYVVYFSAKPITNSYSDQMINTALCHKIIDEVRYIKYYTIDYDELLLDFGNSEFGGGREHSVTT